ncbi:MAG: MTH1187 family thiamine-binding protein [candidate division WOR-3 bacterium]|nr:MAG: MTH1187 family thiamine-binding protein [candidate division WOR-3 bacterium]
MSLMAIVSMTPIGKDESVSEYVAKVVAEIDKSGIPYIITPMGTIIESETWDELMDVLKRGFDSMARNCPRISISVKIDYRKGKSGRIKAKVESLEDKIGKPLPRGR